MPTADQYRDPPNLVAGRQCFFDVYEDSYYLPVFALGEYDVILAGALGLYEYKYGTLDLDSSSPPISLLAVGSGLSVLAFLDLQCILTASGRTPTRHQFNHYYRSFNGPDKSAKSSIAASDPKIWVLVG